jgi:hypothetical protein
MMRCRWWCGCPSHKQLLGLTPAVLGFNLDKNFSKAGMMEGFVSVMLIPVAKSFDQGKSLGNLDQCFFYWINAGELCP